LLTVQSFSGKPFSGRVLDQTVLHRIEMNAVQIRRQIALAKAGASRIVCSQYRRCQMPRSPRRIMTGDRGSPMRTNFENPFLIARQRPGKSASPSGNSLRR
jgi:hypothetical protein